MSDVIDFRKQTTEVERSAVLNVKDLVKTLEQKLQLFSENEKDMIARTLDLKKIPERAKEEVQKTLEASVPQFSQSVTEKVMGDLAKDMEETKTKMNRLTMSIVESTTRVESLNFWTRKTVFIVLAVTFLTAFSGSFLASSYMMIRKPGLYMSILSYMDTSNRIDQDRAQRNRGR